MRIYLDTNILIFLDSSDHREIHPDVQVVLDDYSNLFYTGAPCVRELIHLLQSEKIELKSGRHATDVIPWLSSMGIEIVPLNKYHLATYAELPLYADHHDPDDRMIIAQAIRDRAVLVSSDQKFSRYQSSGLEFIYNRR